MLRCSSTTLLVTILSGGLLCISTLAEPLKGNHIVRVGIGKYPFVVSIKHRPDQFRDEEHHFCTGTLISSRFVLTAAHCFMVKWTGAIRISLGSIDSAPSETYEASTWITYNQWVRSKNLTKVRGSNDIALLKLTHELSDLVVRPVPFAFIKSYDMYYEHVLVFGWAKPHENATIVDPVKSLHEARVKVLPNEVCEATAQRLTNKIQTISDIYLCTKREPSVIIAKGDSGGPVFKQGCVVAVNRGTCPTSSQCNLPEETLNSEKLNIHTVIYPYKEFIIDVLQNY